MPFDFEVHVLTEDSANEAFATVTKVLKKLFLYLEANTETHRIDFRPMEETRLQFTFVPSLWNSSNPKDQRHLRDMGQYIATQLLRDEVPTFVFFHFDGDTKWSQRAASLNAGLFEEIVRFRIRNFVRAVLQRKHALAQLDRVMARFCPITPYYCLEAWAYQNLDVARNLCAEGCGKESHQELFAVWETDRARLDELEPPWNTVCLGKKHNLRLVGAGFPTSEVVDAEASFQATAFELADHDELTECLKKTWRHYGA
ncbi:MAG: hypothetical protein JKY65_33205 [Planctomycetes bacterium]|nr:hypothetical protein [Planctomycetota bacterium]